MIIRPAAQGDLALIWEFRAMAADEPDIATAKESPFVPAHLDGGQRPSHFGVVAEIDGMAAWARHILAEAYLFQIDEHSPVGTIAVRDRVPGTAVGETLRALSGEAASRRVRLSLDGRGTHSAMRFHEPIGLRRDPRQEVRNRIGTLSFAMVHGGGSADP